MIQVSFMSIVCGVLAFAALAEGENPAVFSIMDNGAVADAKTLCTPAIQKTIDFCGDRGGGTVLFPPGEYYCGMLFLRSNVTLHLEAGAVLRGSEDKNDYHPAAERRNLPWSHLLYGEDLENVSITGRGTIDGNGPSFWTSEMINPVARKPKEYRPHSLILLKNCRNVLVRDVTLRNSPCFTLWVLGCDTATIENIRIENPKDGPNTDGIDIDSSTGVHISNCTIDTGDDCIALKTNAWIFKPKKKPCENVTVDNCTFSSGTCAVRIGYEGDAPIQNCVFNNLTVSKAHVGIDAVSILPANEPTLVEGARISGVIFNNIVMNHVERPFFLWLGNQGDGDFTGQIENVMISNLIANATNGCYIGGEPGRPIEGISLKSIKLVMQGNMPTDVTAKPSVWADGSTPWAIYAQHVHGLTCSNIEVDWRKSDGQWQGGLGADQVTDLMVSNCKGFRMADEHENNDN